MAALAILPALVGLIGPFVSDRFLPADLAEATADGPRVEPAPIRPAAAGDDDGLMAAPGTVPEPGQGLDLSVPDLEIPDEVENVGVVTPEVVGPPEVMPEAPVPAATVEDCRVAYVDAPTEEMRVRRNEELKEVGFAIVVRDLEVSLPLISAMANPGEVLAITVHPSPDAEPGDFAVSADGGEVREVAAGNYAWTVPDKPGVACLRFVEEPSGDTLCLHALVREPYGGGAALGGYVIGQYPREPLNGNPRYNPPTGLIRVEKEDVDVWVSPHFRLGQFLCKQESGWPKYMLLETRLLLKLESLVQGLQEDGIDAKSLFVMSGYRTPAYNKAIGNSTSYSRHLYGDAADIFVDTDRDALLDDLNGDGVVDDEDTKFLYRAVEDVSRSVPESLVGGIGFYEFKDWRSAFVHTDTRGYKARWGNFLSAVEAPDNNGREEGSAVALRAGKVAAPHHP